MEVENVQNGEVDRALRTFAPESAHELLLSSAEEGLSDILIIAKCLTPKLTQELVQPQAREILEELDRKQIRTLVAEPDVLAWIDGACRLVRMSEAELGSSRAWIAHLKRLNIIISAAAVLKEVSVDLSVSLEPGAIEHLPIVGVVLENKSTDTVVSEVRVQPPNEVIIKNECIKQVRDLTIEGFVLAFRGESAQSPPDASYGHLSREECNLSLWAGSLRRARELTALNANWDVLVNKFCRIIGPLQGRADRHVSVSCQASPKVVFLSESSNGLVVAEALVHESDHNLLYALNRKVDFWKDPVLPYEARHWSPWRTDLRPLDGILRGASAFTSVGEFLLDVFTSTRSSDEEKNTALWRAILSAAQVREAIHALDGNQEVLSAAGSELVEQLQIRVEHFLAGATFVDVGEFIEERCGPRDNNAPNEGGVILLDVQMRERSAAVAAVMNGIGDALLALPAIRHLETIYGRDAVFVATTRKLKQTVLAEFGGRAFVIEGDKRDGLCLTRPEVERLRAGFQRWPKLEWYSLNSYFPPRQAEAQVIDLLGAEIVARLSDLVFDTSVRELRMRSMLSAVVETVGVSARLARASRAPAIPTGAKHFARQFVRQRARGRIAVAIHTDTASGKQWRNQNWIALAKAARKHGLIFFLLGEPHSELARSSTLVAIPTQNWHYHLAVLSQSRCFIGVDSCFAHAADALGLPGLVLFGPTPVAVWGPQGPKLRALVAPTNLAVNALPVAVVAKKLFGIKPLS